MKTKRTRLDIVADILKFCEKETTQTQLIQKVRISHTSMVKYLPALTAKGLLEKTQRQYKTTDKGMLLKNEIGEINKKLAL